MNLVVNDVDFKFRYFALDFYDKLTGTITNQTSVSYLSKIYDSNVAFLQKFFD